MNREEKTIVIESLADQLSQYPHFYLADASGLNAAQTAKLRKMCFEKEVNMVVVKNTLFSKALEKANKADAELLKTLTGSTAVMFTNVSKTPAMLIKEFRKTSPKPILKGAFVEESVYIGDAMLEELANIKNKEELIGDIISMLQSPAKNVISGLQAAAGQKIAGLLKTLEERN